MNILKLINNGVENIGKKVLEEGPYKDEKHLDDHMKHKDQIDPSLTRDKFNVYGDYLYTTPIDNKNIFGFISCSNGVYGVAKYDKKNRIFIVYDFDDNNKPFTRTTMRFGMDRYLKIKERDYVGDVPQGV